MLLLKSYFQTWILFCTISPQTLRNITITRNYYIYIINCYIINSILLYKDNINWLYCLHNRVLANTTVQKLLKSSFRVLDFSSTLLTWWKKLPSRVRLEANIERAKQNHDQDLDLGKNLAIYQQVSIHSLCTQTFQTSSTNGFL